MMFFAHTLRMFIGRVGRSASKINVVLLGLFLLLSSARAALAEYRVALVIGNGAYADAPLRNPTNDARDIAAKLRELGFQVIERLDADRQTMRLALREFEQQLRQQRGVGLFYYAGHGVQIKGQNYLIPVGVDVRQEFEIPDEGVDADAVLRAMESAGNGLNIVILDACRNNPFTRSLGNRGLARMDGPAGTFIAYATAPGAVSSDGGGGRNSPYTRSLLAAMSTPGLGLEQVFKQVLVAVEQETNGNQVPWVASSLRGDFYFIPPSPAPSSAALPTLPTPTPAATSAAPLQSPTDSRSRDSQQPVAPLEPRVVAVPNAHFAISRQPISLNAYSRFAEAVGQAAPPTPASASDEQPARVTWKEAMDYGAWLSRQTGNRYRLPTEAEWEQAAQLGVVADNSSDQDREWTCSEYRTDYEGQERRCAHRLPETVAIRGDRWRAGADPLSADLEFRLIQEQ